MIDAMVNDVLGETRRRLRRGRPGLGCRIFAASSQPVVAFSGAMVQNDRALKSFLFEHMYRHRSVTA